MCVVGKCFINQIQNITRSFSATPSLHHGWRLNKKVFSILLQNQAKRKRGVRYFSGEERGFDCCLKRTISNCEVT